MCDSRLALTSWEEVLSDLSTRVPQAELREIAAELKASVREIVGDLPDGQKIRIDRYKLTRALACPASAVDTEFVPTAITTSRALGLLAIESPSADRIVPDNVLTAIDRSIEAGLWTAGFLEGQDTASRAATVGYALSWANRALTQVPRHVLTDATIQHNSTFHSPLGYGTPVVLVARPDFILRPPDGAANDRVLLSIGWPDIRVAALDALAVALAHGAAPQRCLTAYPPSGSVHSVDVDAELLRTAVGDVAHAVAALAPGRRGEPLHAEPGASCWNCEQREHCDPGQRWMELQPRRRSGLLIEDSGP